jgi:hypothetical protein
MSKLRPWRNPHAQPISLWTRAAHMDLRIST